MPCGQMNIPPPKLATALPSGANFTIDVEIGIQTLVTEFVGAGVAAQHRPDVLPIRIHIHVADGADLSAAGQLGPPIDGAIRVRQGLGQRGTGRTEAEAEQRECERDYEAIVGHVFTS